MIKKITDLPDNIVGFVGSGEISAADFENTVFPYIRNTVEKTGELNYVLVLDISFKNFSLIASFQNLWLAVKYLGKWNRGAIISNSKLIKEFADISNIMSSGEFKGFYHKDIFMAIDWVSNKTVSSKSSQWVS
jgi:hypothetical protein